MVKQRKFSKQGGFLLCCLIALAVSVGCLQWASAADEKYPIKIRGMPAKVKTVTLYQDGQEIATVNPELNPKKPNAELAAGLYQYTGYDSKKNKVGSGEFEVTENTTQIFFQSTSFEVYMPPDVAADTGEDLSGHATLTCTNKDYQFEPANNDPDVVGQGSKSKTYMYLLASEGSNNKTTVRFEYFLDAEAVICEPSIFHSTIFTPRSNKINVLRAVMRTFRVPNEYADSFQLYKKRGDHYTAFDKIAPHKTETKEDGYTEFVYKLMEQTSVHYTIQHDPKKNNIKLSRGLSFNRSTPTVIPVRGYSKDKKDYQTGNFDNDNWTNFDLDNTLRLNRSKSEESNLYLNVEDSNYIQMQSGETKKLEAFRTWQAVDDVIGNHFIEPDFHYEVIGDSVKVEENLGEEGRRYATLTAKQEGASVIKVTYDAMFWSQMAHAMDYSKDEGANSLYYNAIDPVNTRVVIVNVGGNNDANIQPNIYDKKTNAGTEYSTIYFDKNKTDHAEYTFKPTANEAMTVRVHDPLHNTEWNTAWTEYQPNEDGSYTVDLKDGRNIIEISAGNSVQYYVLNCRALDVQIKNLTRPSSDDYQVGDEIEVSFDGLSLPVQKMAGIYNPNFPDQGWVEYQTDGGRILRSMGAQYNAVTKAASKIKFVLTEPGEFKMVNGRIHNTHLGDGLDSHRNIPAEGKGVNMGAEGGQNSPYFSTLPDITLTVKPNQEEAYHTFSYAQLQSWTANDKYAALTASDWAGLDAVRNQVLVNELYMGDDDRKSQVDLTMNAEPLNDNVTLTARFREEGATEWENLGEVTPNELVTLKEKLSTKSVYYVEVTVTPKNEADGDIHTYTLRMTTAQSNNQSILKANPMLTNLQVQAADSSLEPMDGVLRATGDGTDGLGYGFLAGRHEFTVTVPETVKSLTVTPTAVGEQKVGTSESGNYLEDAVYPTITVNGQTVENQKASEAIALTGENDTITVTLSAAAPERTTTYTIHVKTVKNVTASFENLMDGATLTLRDASGKRITANEDGTYTLRSGESYSYVYSKNGYKTVTGEVTASEEMTPVQLPELVKIDQADGAVTVRIAGPQSMPKQTTTVNYKTAETKDLASQGWVDYNHGGYTVLHALIDSCSAGSNRIEFTCTKGNFAPKLDLSNVDTSAGAGWVCEVNGNLVTDPANTLVKPDDKIEYYYNCNHDGMTHAWFAQDTLRVTKGESATVKLLGTKVKNDGTEAAPVADAQIYVGSELAGQTNENGELLIEASHLDKLGTHTITAQKINESGKNILTYALSTVMVKKDTGAAEPENKTKVTFRLIGSTKANSDVDFGKDTGYNGAKYVTWIATEDITINKSSATVGEVFRKALDNAGLDYKGLENNYISSITAPEVCGGYELAEFTNGRRSGWMYTVNGEHPNLGLNDWEVTSGDEIVWHYVNDYLYEVHDWESSGGEPGKGDESTWNKWLDAKDVNPSSGSATAPEEDKGSVTIEPSTKPDKNGQATVTVSKGALENAIEAAKNEDAEHIVIAPDISGDADKIVIKLPKDAADKILQKTDAGLRVDTTLGMLTLPQDTLKEALDAAKGDDFTITFTKGSADQAKTLLKDQKLTEEQLSDCVVTEVTISSNEKKITDFGGKRLTLRLPVDGAAFADGKSYTVYQVSEDGSVEKLTGKCVKKSNKLYVEISAAHTGTFVVLPQAVAGELPFTDIAGHWAVNAIEYVYENGLFAGTSDTTFGPNVSMNRAMLVTVLYRMAGEPNTTGKNAFADVAAGQWYTDAVTWAAENQIVSGYSADQFGPTDTVTREQIASILMRYAKFKGYDISKANDLAVFTDADTISVWALDAVKWANAEKLINGRTATTLVPKGTATRAEVAQILMMFQQNVVK